MPCQTFWNYIIIMRADTDVDDDDDASKLPRDEVRTLCDAFRHATVPE